MIKSVLGADEGQALVLSEHPYVSLVVDAVGRGRVKLDAAGARTLGDALLRAADEAEGRESSGV